MISCETCNRISPGWTKNQKDKDHFYPVEYGRVCSICYNREIWFCHKCWKSEPSYEHYLIKLKKTHHKQEHASIDIS